MSSDVNYSDRIVNVDTAMKEVLLGNDLFFFEPKTIGPKPELIPQIIVAGSREFNDYLLFSLTMELLTKDLAEFVVISGKASRGADAMAIQWCREKGIMCREFPADWDLGKGAGYIRNEDMARVATHLVAFWDLASRGTRHMINISKRYKLITTVVIV